MTDAELLDALQKLTETQFDEVQRLCVPANLRRHLASSRAPLAGTLFAAEVLYFSTEFEPEVILPTGLPAIRTSLPLTS